MNEMKSKAEKLLARQLEQQNINMMNKMRQQTEVIHNQELVNRVQRNHSLKIQKVTARQFSAKYDEAKKVRQESKILEKEKVKQSVLFIKENIGKRDSIYKDSQINQIKRSNQSTKINNILATMIEKNNTKSVNIKELKQKDRQIQELANQEKVMLSKLHRTLKA